MMQSAETRKSNHLPVLGRLDLSPRRRVCREGHVRPILVVEFHVLANASEEVPFAEHDQVIGQFASERPDEPLRVAILPRRARRNSELTDTEVVAPPVEGRAEDLVSVADEQLERTRTTKT